MMTRSAALDIVSPQTYPVTAAQRGPEPGELAAAMRTFGLRVLRVIGISVGTSLALAWTSANFFQGM